MRLPFETQVGDLLDDGPEHRTAVVRDATDSEPSPYILIRANLGALIERKSFYAWLI